MHGRLRKNKFGMIALIMVMIIPAVILAGCQDEAVEETGSQGIFYEVRGGETELYLFGSVHVGEEDMYPLRNAVMEAFEGADLLAMELDLESIDEMAIAQEMSEAAMFQDGRRLRDVIEEDTFYVLILLTQEYGFTAEVMDLFQPWYAAMLASQIAVEESRFSQEYGIEQFFMDEREDQEIIGLEDVMDQLRPFLLMDDEAQKEYLEQTLEELETLEEDFTEMVDRWIEGDTEYFERIRSEMLEEETTESIAAYQQAISDERDEQMTEKIVELMESGDHDQIFVVVGALHLVGDLGIPARLEDMGYEVILH